MRITLYLPSLEGGGIERLYLGLAQQFTAQGHETTLLLNSDHGELKSDIPDGVRTMPLGVRRQALSVPALVRYLRTDRPDIVMSGHDHNNVMLSLAGMAKPSATRIVVSQHNTLSTNAERGAKFGVVPFLYRHLLHRADGIVSVSNGVGDDLALYCGIDRTRIETIYNGVVPDDLDARTALPSREGVMEADGRPVILAAGRMVEQKDFTTLITAFAALRRTFDAKLVILGDGPLRAAHEKLARDLGIAEHVAMPGFLPNPFAYLARAQLFVLSSRYEGFGNVVAEALACGTPVVSTDCQHGPAEILDGGRFGILTAPGDATSMARAMADALQDEHDREALRARGAIFSEKNSASRYLDLFDRLLSPAASRRMAAQRSHSGRTV